MKILVTGGAGYIGSHTVKKLVKNNHNVLVYDNLSNGHKKAVDKKAKLIIGDLGDKNKINQVIKNFKPKGIIHFAGFIQVGESVKNPAKYYINNNCYGLNLLESMVKNNIKYIIYSSSAGVYGEPKKIPINEEDSKDPINTYGKTKLIFEWMLSSYEKAFDIKWIALRYFNAAGASPDAKIGEDHSPETHIIPLIIKTALGQKKKLTIFGNNYPTPDGTCIRDYIHVEDLADAHEIALKYLIENKKSDIFNLGTGKGISIKKLINSVKKISKINFKIEYGPKRMGDPAQLIANPTKAINILKWKAKYDNIDNIVETAWKWHKENPQGFSSHES